MDKKVIDKKTVKFSDKYSKLVLRMAGNRINGKTYINDFHIPWQIFEQFWTKLDIMIEKLCLDKICQFQIKQFNIKQ